MELRIPGDDDCATTREDTEQSTGEGWKTSEMMRAAGKPCRSPLSEVKNSQTIADRVGAAGDAKTMLMRNTAPDVNIGPSVRVDEREQGGGAPVIERMDTPRADGATASSCDEDALDGNQSDTDKSATKSTIVRRKVAYAMDMAITNFEARCAELQQELEEARRVASRSSDEKHSLMEMNAMLTWRLAEMELTLSEQQQQTTDKGTTVCNDDAESSDAKSIAGGVENVKSEIRHCDDGRFESDGERNDGESAELESNGSRSCTQSAASSPSLSIRGFFRNCDEVGAAQRPPFDADGIASGPDVDILAEVTTRMWLAEAKAELLAERLKELAARGACDAGGVPSVKRGDAVLIKQTDVDALRRENQNLLTEIERTAEERHIEQANQAEMEAKAAMAMDLERELAQERAANYELACKHKAGLSRLQEVMQGDSRLRQQIAAQSELISKLESQRKDITIAIENHRQLQHRHHADSDGRDAAAAKLEIRDHLDEMMKENESLRDEVKRQHEAIGALASRGEDLVRMLLAVQPGAGNGSLAEATNCDGGHGRPTAERAVAAAGCRVGVDYSDSDAIEAVYRAKWDAAEAERKFHVEKIQQLEEGNLALERDVCAFQDDAERTKTYISHMKHDAASLEKALLSLMVAIHGDSQGPESAAAAHSSSDGYYTFHQWMRKPLSWKLEEISRSLGKVGSLFESEKCLTEALNHHRSLVSQYKHEQARLGRSIEVAHEREAALRREATEKARTEQAVREELKRTSKALASLDADSRVLRQDLANALSERDSDKASTKRFQLDAQKLEGIREGLTKELNEALERERTALGKAEEYLKSAKEGEKAAACLGTLRKEISVLQTELEAAKEALKSAQAARLKDGEALSVNADRMQHLHDVNSNQVKEIGSLKAELRRVRAAADSSRSQVDELVDAERLARAEQEKCEKDLQAARIEISEMERSQSNANHALSLSTGRIHAYRGQVKTLQDELSRETESRLASEGRATSLQARCDALESTLECMKTTHAEVVQSKGSLQTELDSACEMIGEMEKANTVHEQESSERAAREAAMAAEINAKTRDNQALQRSVSQLKKAKGDAEEKLAKLRKRCESVDVLEATLDALRQQQNGGDDAKSEGEDTLKDHLVSLLSSNTTMVKEISERLTSSLLEKPSSLQHLESVAEEDLIVNRSIEAGVPRFNDSAATGALERQSLRPCENEAPVGSQTDDDTMSESSDVSTRAHASSMRKLLAKAKKYREQKKALEARLMTQEEEHRRAIALLEAKADKAIQGPSN